MSKVLVLTRGKEFIILRKARKLHQCHECHHGIPKGCSYVEDHINYLMRKRDGGAWKKWYTNPICLLCWRGKIP